MIYSIMQVPVIRRLKHSTSLDMDRLAYTFEKLHFGSRVFEVLLF